MYTTAIFGMQIRIWRAFSYERNAFLQLPPNAAFFPKCTFSALSISGRKGALSVEITAHCFAIYRTVLRAKKFCFCRVSNLAYSPVCRSIHARTLSLGANFRFPICNVGKSARFKSWYAPDREMPSSIAICSAFSTSG